ncbi:MAG: hypothetical protein IPK44_13145 [Candidatus Accumulibacter sp.]|uniref:hypothetical protein n=1 Tax=Accumulibacter sp. TaxID=2053492 RepID=UPI001AD16A60|nr:hypothetical protein [Accumulibacter sp.]MBK8115395.1 hypothetical protein [Accumulibacter sp.]MBK8384195.1 hypothetical protein [Accumulibacter sp.]MBK8578161.1 hypothetical protein [Candidatus Accumulibacter propinquus]MBN8439334.1 hypothetical protein [Accumulibacter sp.]
MATDYAYWNETAATFAPRKELGGKKLLLLVAGKVSSQAQQDLAKADWTVKSGLHS